MYCCDRKSRAAYAQSFALWQHLEQATIEFTCHDHSSRTLLLRSIVDIVSIIRDYTPRSLYCCLFAPHICMVCSSRTSRSWWITQSTQHHRRGFNSTYKSSHFQRTLRCHLVSTKQFDSTHSGSDVTDEGQGWKPPPQAKCENHDPLSLYFGFIIFWYSLNLKTYYNRCSVKMLKSSCVRRKFSWGILFSGVWCHFYLVCLVCDVIIWRQIHVFQANVFVNFAPISLSR